MQTTQIRPSRRVTVYESRVDMCSKCDDWCYLNADGLCRTCCEADRRRLAVDERTGKTTAR